MAEDHASPIPTRSRAVVVTALGDIPDLGMGIELLPAGNSRRSNRAGTGVPRAWVFAAFSASLLIAAFCGPAVGRIIDRHGGRGVLTASNFVLAAGLLALGAAAGPISLFARLGGARCRNGAGTLRRGFRHPDNSLWP